MPCPAWLQAAHGEAGVCTFAPGSSNPRVTVYHGHTNLQGYDDKASWCSSFVNWSLAQAGITGTGSALARSWLDWGEPLEAPLPGCVVVLTRDDPASWKGHVGFYVRQDPGLGLIYLWGGNQLDKVCENSYPLGSVLAYRWPCGVPRPEIS